MPYEGKYLAPPSKAARILHTIYSVLMSLALGAAGIAVAAGAAWLSLSYQNSLPILLTPPDSATGQLVSMLDAVCAGRYDEASSYLLGTPDLGVDEIPEDDIAALLWDRYQQSITYELVGECYTTKDGLAQDIRITCLDLTSVTENLRFRSQTLLEQMVADAEDLTQVYDENYEYREDVVMDILHQSVQDALALDARSVTAELTVNLKYQDGKWWILVDTALLDAISGGILF